MSYMYRLTLEIFRFHSIPLSFFLYSPFKDTVHIVLIDGTDREWHIRLTSVPFNFLSAVAIL